MGLVRAVSMFWSRAPRCLGLWRTVSCRVVAGAMGTGTPTTMRRVGGKPGELPKTEDGAASANGTDASDAPVPTSQS